jgi:hypothetical protein
MLICSYLFKNDSLNPVNKKKTTKEALDSTIYFLVSSLGNILVFNYDDDFLIWLSV